MKRRKFRIDQITDKFSFVIVHLVIWALRSKLNIHAISQLETYMENGNHVITDELLVKHFAYIGVVMMGIALGIGFVANYIG